MSYEQLQQDLDHLLLTSQEIVERERECELLSQLGATIDKAMRMRKWAAQMLQHSDDDARVYANWLLGRTSARIEDQSHSRIEEEKPTAFARLAQHFVNGGLNGTSD